MKRLTYMQLYAKGRTVDVGSMTYHYPSPFGTIDNGVLIDANGHPIRKESYKKEDYYQGRLLEVNIKGNVYLVPFFLINPLYTMKECDGADLEYLYIRVLRPEFHRCRISIEEMDTTNTLQVDPTELWLYIKGYLDDLLNKYGIDKWEEHSNSMAWVNYCLERRKSTNDNH